MPDGQWVAEGHFHSERCPSCGKTLRPEAYGLPATIRAEADTKTEVKEKIFRMVLESLIRHEVERWKGPERSSGFGDVHVHELTKLRLANLEALADYRPVPEAAIAGGQLDVAYVSRVTGEIVAAFEVDSKIKEKSIRKLATLPENAIKVLVTTNPGSPGYGRRLARVKPDMERAGILHLVVKVRPH
jgi:hypothetical protein